MCEYIIITPAYNEEGYIGQTIDSVLAQTVLPKLWLIVDDGSSDGTAAIIQQKAADHPWIRYVYRCKTAGQTYFASNVYAIEEGLKQARDLAYGNLAILDADITLPPDYYERVFRCFAQDPKLGVASGVYVTRDGGRLKKVLSDRRSCPKSIMVFRRECFEAIGGFVPLNYGSEDTCACFMVRMKGWKAWSYPDIEVVHNKPAGTGHAKSLVGIRFRQGVGDYFMATHPLFMMFKSARRCVGESPVLIGGLARLAGFICAHFTKEPRQIPEDVIRFIRKEQFQRILTGNRSSVLL